MKKSLRKWIEKKEKKSGYFGEWFVWSVILNGYVYICMYICKLCVCVQFKVNKLAITI